ncbi:MAG: hypothetical protein LBL13_14095 [Bacteroidales bacterium]|jgi:hypothetical protein|nr:hypothetical protein [Bacteroidales bacterium]
MNNFRIKSISIWLFFIFYLLQGKAILVKDRIYYLNPPDFLHETQDLRKNKQYKEIENLVKRKMQDAIELWHYHQLACMRALQGDTVLPFEYLYNYIDFKTFAVDILTDTDLEILYSTNQWKKLKDSVYTTYLSQYSNIENKELSLKLWLFGIEDQRNRILARNNKKIFVSQEEQKAYYEGISKNQEDAIRFVEKLINQKIFPSYSMVGEEASNAATLIIKHYAGKKTLKKALPLLKKNHKLKQVNPREYASIIDNYLLKQRKKNLYATGVWRYNQINANGLPSPCSDYFFSPIKDEKNVNQRLKALGIESIEEFAASYGFTYQYNPENDKLSFNQINKRNREIARKQCEGK